MACSTCPRREKCSKICTDVRKLLPREDEARLNSGDHSPSELERIHREMSTTKTVIDLRDALKGRQSLVIDLYYNDLLNQVDISKRLDLSQKSVHTYLARAYRRIRKLALNRRRRTFRSLRLPVRRTSQ
jgi:DNA-directed RNA polymerase specialized sigma subunit